MSARSLTRPTWARIGLTLAALLFTRIAISADQALIPYEKYVLDNGLTLIVHEDHKAPIVAVNMWYHVGSRNETPGKTGYAHLFEHLMFQGSENSEGEFLEQLEKIGATTLNGTTWFDRTNYYQTVPVNALDRVLFLESDRMGHMLGAIDQAVLDEQRGVVQNEKRQGDNQPYAKVWSKLIKQLYSDGHPYSWETIGSMEDLEAASLEDMQTWFKTYYGPNNAVLVIAGDVAAEQVRDRVAHYFGDIPAGPPLSVQKEWIPMHSTERREVIQDRVPQERLYLGWTGPRWGTEEAAYLTMARAILASGKNSRLYKRLVYTDQLVTDISMEGYALEIAGLEALEASIKDGADIRVVEQIAREELQKFIDKGPTAAELKRTKARLRASFIRGIERIGGPGSKSAVLAENMVYGNDPGLYETQQNTYAEATRADLQKVAAKWYGQAPYVADFVPFPEYSQADSGADRSVLPEPAPPKDAVFPRVDRATLSNGLKLAVVSRPTIPVIDFDLIFDAGYASDRPEMAGKASMAMAMLDEGAGKLDALEISDQLALLGAQIGTGVGLDTASVSLSALSENLDESLKLFATIVLEPSFPDEELERMRSQYLSLIEQEKSTPTNMALRLLPGLLYGDDHAYSQPLTGSGTEASINAVTRVNLVDWHTTWFRPNNATLVVVGDTTIEQIKPRIEALFESWTPAAVPEKNISMIDVQPNDIVYLIDKPQAEQSMIFAGQLVTPLDNPDEVAIQAMNDVLGGQFSSRVNINLRETKHWSYGARSLIMSTKAQRPFIMYAPVQTDKTGPSLSEMHREITELRSSNPPKAEELQRIQRSRTLSLPGRWETNGAVAGAVAEIVMYDLPHDHWDGYANRINSLELEQLKQAAIDTLDPAKIVWVIVGDREKIEAQIRATHLGTIKLIDTDGNPVNSSDE